MRQDMQMLFPNMIKFPTQIKERIADVTIVRQVLQMKLKQLPLELHHVSIYAQVNWKRGRYPRLLQKSDLLKAVEIYTYVYDQLKHLLDFRDMKPIVFQNFRAIGNCIAFLNTRIELDQSGFKFDIFEH